MVINSIISIRASGQTWGSKETKVTLTVKSIVIPPLGPKGLGLAQGLCTRLVPEMLYGHPSAN